MKRKVARRVYVYEGKFSGMLDCGIKKFENDESFEYIGEYRLAGSERRKVVGELRKWVDILTCLGGDLIHKKELLAKLKEMEDK